MGDAVVRGVKTASPTSGLLQESALFLPLPHLAAAQQREALNLLLAVRVDRQKLLVEHSGQGGFRKEIAGVQGAALDTLQSVMTEIRRRYPQNADVLVVPADDVAYDDLIHVLERLRVASYSGISLGNRTRSTQIAASQASSPATSPRRMRRPSSRPRRSTRCRLATHMMSWS